MNPRRHTGRFLGISYDLRRPTRRRLGSRSWNPKDAHVIVPKAHGWGCTINFAALRRRRRVRRR
jgi:hypothetical protein